MTGLEPTGVSPTSPRSAVLEAGLYVVARVRASDRKVVLMQEPTNAPERMLTVAEVAEMVGVRPASWRTMVTRGQAPAPDDPDADRAPNRRSPRWRAATIAEFQAGRKGRGFRSDLRRAK